MKLLTILLLSTCYPIQYLSAQTSHAYQSQKIPLVPTDSLTFKKTRAKDKSISIQRGTRVKVKETGTKAVKGFVHAFSNDSLAIITKNGLQSIHLPNLKFLVVFHGLKKQTISSEMISKGTLLAIPALFGLALALRESATQGDLEKIYYQSTAILGIPAAALMITGSMIRKKKLNMTKWSIPKF